VGYVRLRVTRRLRHIKGPGGESPMQTAAANRAGLVSELLEVNTICMLHINKKVDDI
jgi:hypothetical protein